MNTLTFIQLAGLLQVSLLAPGLAMARTVRLREAMAPLPEFHRRLFWVYYGFTGIHFVGCGLVTFFAAEGIAAGGALARGFCAFLAVYWAARVAVGAFVFNVRPYLATNLHRVGYHALNLVFVYLVVVFTWLALRPAPQLP